MMIFKLIIRLILKKSQNSYFMNSRKFSISNMKSLVRYRLLIKFQKVTLIISILLINQFNTKGIKRFKMVYLLVAESYVSC